MTTKKPSKKVSPYIITRTSVGINPKFLINDSDVLPFYQRLQAYAEYTGASAYSPPKQALPPSFVLGRLTASDNSLQTEVSKAAIDTTWTNTGLSQGFNPSLEDMKTLVDRIVSDLKADIVSLSVAREYIYRSNDVLSDNILDSKWRGDLKRFIISLTYPSTLPSFTELETTYNFSNLRTSELPTGDIGGEYQYTMNCLITIPFDANTPALPNDKVATFLDETAPLLASDKLLAVIKDGAK